MKFFNGIDSSNLLFLQGLGSLLRYLKGACSSYLFPDPVASAAGNDYEVVADCPLSGGDNVDIAIRVYKWVHGTTLSAVGATPELLFQEGQAVGAFSTAMIQFGDEHKGFHRLHFWDGAHFVSNVKPFLDIIPDSSDLKGIIRDVFATFEREVVPDAHLFPRSVVMGDCNDANIIVSACSDALGGTSKVVGLIDFGDTTYSWSILELSNALAYGLVTKFGQKHPILSTMNIFAGFISSARDRISMSNCALTDIELKHLHALACARLCTSVTMGLYSLSKDPSNEYLKLHAMPAQNALRFLASLSPIDFTQMLSSLQHQVQLAPIGASCGSHFGNSFTLPMTRLIIAEEEAFHKASSFNADADKTAMSFVDPTSGVVRLTFVTGNKKKLEEVVAILSTPSPALDSKDVGVSTAGAPSFPYEISSVSIDLPELQGADPEVVAKEKCKLAAQQVRCFS
jgi:Ser/Thr protein kinase RdoA (MazF antagonist)